MATSGGLVNFMREQLGKPIPSPAVLGQISERFRDEVKAMAEQQKIPLYQFNHKERKDDVANALRRKRGTRDGIVFIGVAQEKAQAFQGKKIDGQFQYTRDKTVYVSHYYFYIDDAGSDWNLSIWRMEVSLTQIFDRVVTKKTPGEFRTRVIQDGVHPSLHINYKNFDLKQYFKEGREINRRLLEVERVSHNSGLSGDSIQRVVQPTVTKDGEKPPALKFGQPGGQDQLNLRRLRRKGLIFRPPKTHRYFITTYGRKVARLFTRLETGVFRPAVAVFTTNDAVLPFPIRASLNRADAQLDELIYEAFPQAKVA